jgi:5-methylcytosine-specific restriction protein A
MKVLDLTAPVTASKADWLAATTWMGFTPTGEGPNARSSCQSSIRRQFGNGYVLEYITEQFNEPNLGFENDPGYLAERAAHAELAGRLIAIHKLRTTSRSLVEIVGPESFKRTQDMWATDGKRWRWSVAFPIVESFDLVERPKARDVFGEDSYRFLYRYPSAGLRSLLDEHRSALSDLKLERRQAANAFIGVEDEFELADRSQINASTQRLINEDFREGAFEGMSDEYIARLRKRAAWIADRFIRLRQTEGKLYCDDCGFNPANVLDPTVAKPRSMLDVHHKHPLEEGVRYTQVEDFALLCPTCHRVEHQRIKHNLAR